MRDLMKPVKKKTAAAAGKAKPGPDDKQSGAAATGKTKPLAGAEYLELNEDMWEAGSGCGGLLQRQKKVEQAGAADGGKQKTAAEQQKTAGQKTGGDEAKKDGGPGEVAEGTITVRNANKRERDHYSQFSYSFNRLTNHNRRSFHDYMKKKVLGKMGKAIVAWVPDVEPDKAAPEYVACESSLKKLLAHHGLWDESKHGELGFAFGADGRVLLRKSGQQNEDEARVVSLLDGLRQLLPSTRPGSDTRWLSVQNNSSLGVGFGVIRRLFEDIDLGGMHVGGGDYTPPNFNFRQGSLQTRVDWSVLCHLVSIAGKPATAISAKVYKRSRLESRVVNLFAEKSHTRSSEMRERFNACGSSALLQLQGKTFKDDTDLITAGDKQSFVFHKSLRLHSLVSTLRSYAGFEWRFGLGEAHEECLRWVVSQVQGLTEEEQAERIHEIFENRDPDASLVSRFRTKRLGLLEVRLVDSVRRIKNKEARRDIVLAAAAYIELMDDHSILVEFYHMAVQTCQRALGAWRGGEAVNAAAFSAFISRKLSDAVGLDILRISNSIARESKEKAVFGEEVYRFGLQDRRWLYRAFLRCGSENIINEHEASAEQYKNGGGEIWRKGKNLPHKKKLWFETAKAVAAGLSAQRAVAIETLEKKLAGLRDDKRRRDLNCEFWLRVRDRVELLACEVPLRRVREFEDNIIFDLEVAGPAPPLIDTSPFATYEKDLGVAYSPDQTSAVGKFAWRVLQGAGGDEEGGGQLVNAKQPELLPIPRLLAFELPDGPKKGVYVIFWIIGKPAGFVAVRVADSELGLHSVDLYALLEAEGGLRTVTSFAPEIADKRTAWTRFFFVDVEDHYAEEVCPCPENYKDEKKVGVKFVVADAVCRDEYLKDDDVKALAIETNGEEEVEAMPKRPRKLNSERVRGGGTLADFFKLQRLGLYCSAQAYLDIRRKYRLREGLAKKQARLAKKLTRKRAKDKKTTRDAVARSKKQQHAVEIAEAVEKITDEGVSLAAFQILISLWPELCAEFDNLAERDDPMGLVEGLLPDAAGLDESSPTILHYQNMMEVDYFENQMEVDSDCASPIRELRELFAEDATPAQQENCKQRSAGDACEMDASLLERAKTVDELLHELDPEWPVEAPPPQQSSVSSDARSEQQRCLDQLLVRKEIDAAVETVLHPVPIEEILDPVTGLPVPESPKAERFPSRTAENVFTFTADSGVATATVAETERVPAPSPAARNSPGSALAKALARLMQPGARSPTPADAMKSSLKQPSGAPQADGNASSLLHLEKKSAVEAAGNKLQDKDKPAAASKPVSKSVRFQLDPSSSSSALPAAIKGEANADTKQRQQVIARESPRKLLAAKWGAYKERRDKEMQEVRAQLGGFEIMFRGSAKLYAKKGEAGKQLIARPLQGSEAGDRALHIHEKYDDGWRWLQSQKAVCLKQRDFVAGERGKADDYLSLWMAYATFVAERFVDDKKQLPAAWTSGRYGDEESRRKKIVIVFNNYIEPWVAAARASMNTKCARETSQIDALTSLQEDVLPHLCGFRLLDPVPPEPYSLPGGPESRAVGKYNTKKQLCEQLAEQQPKTLLLQKFFVRAAGRKTEEMVKNEADEDDKQIEQTPRNFVTAWGEMGMTPTPTKNMDYGERKKTVYELVDRAGSYNNAANVLWAGDTSITPVRKLLPRQKVHNRKAAKLISRKQGKQFVDGIVEMFDELPWDEMSKERGRKVLARVVANKKYGIDQKAWESFEELHQRIAKEIEDEETNQRGVALNDQQERQREKMRAVQGTFLNILALKQFGGMSTNMQTSLVETSDALAWLRDEAVMPELSAQDCIENVFGDDFIRDNRPDKEQGIPENDAWDLHCALSSV
eukprot:g3281.t1